MPTGIKDFDRITGGLHKQELWIIGARPGTGKSALLTKIALENANKNKRVLFFSLEMSGYSLRKRIYSKIADVSALKIRMPWLLTSTDFNALTKNCAKIYDQQLFIVDTPGLNTDLIESFICNLRPDIVLLDFIQLMKLAKGANRHEGLGEIALEFQELAKRYDIPFVMASQLNRDYEKREDGIPKNSDLRDSGNLEEYAHVILLLYPKIESEIESTIGAIVSKNRHGPLMAFDLKFIPDRVSFA